VTKPFKQCVHDIVIYVWNVNKHLRDPWWS